ncbi:hepatocyte growth factor receptor-like isoform X2 [Acanthaster planci]|uniref:Hepatocyte growth factor receptor n=1 Tax=Acanthaster planci TaxID=133434 RepID=A0A8B7XLQ9_ACAPL|nr:hepatocyte growth factor receptor-like isoform X2 [Acanthaster planci]
MAWFGSTSLVLTLICASAFAVTEKQGLLSAYEVASFTNPHPDPNAKLNHVTFHGPSDIYVGAVNSIYRLDENLVPLSNASTAFDCPDAEDCANENKILFVEPTRNRLITCGSDNDGRCQQRDRIELTVVNASSVVEVSPGRGKTTVGVLAPGPGGRDWFYVASTYTEDGTFPPVARRDLDQSLPDPRLLLSDEDSKISFNSDYRSRAFDISYVYGFTLNNFTYFVTAQQETIGSSAFVSKLVRVCHTSPSLDSYSEIILRCGQESGSYNLAQAAFLGEAGPDLATSLGIAQSSQMLFTVFATSIGSSDTPTDTSALCAFNMNEIEEAFMTAVQGCVQTGDAYKVGYLQGSRCRTVHLENRTYARLYETIKLGDSAVLTDISLDDSKQELRILTERQLLKLRVENCNQYKTCESCIGENAEQDGDPYCGWCTLQDRCTKRSDCVMAQGEYRWLPYNALQCVGISVVPDNLPITSPPQMIVVTVDQLPELVSGESYICKFNDLPVGGETVDHVIKCMTPENSAIPPIPPKESHVTMTLSLFASESGVNFFRANFSFYSCSRFDLCSSCVSSDWSCDWCVYSNRCTHQSTECTQEDIIVAGNSNPGASSVRGPGFCPQLRPQTEEVLIPVGVPSDISVPAFNLPDSPQMNVTYQCDLTVEGVKQATIGTLLQNDVIQCNAKEYLYSGDTQELTVRLTVSWNGDRQLEDSAGFTVTLYNCAVDRPDCSRCLSNETARPELECRWCGDQCAYKEEDICTAMGVALDSTDPCPPPELLSVYPESGPLEGNTVIEITGTNIGRHFQEIHSVIIGQKPCDLTGLEDHYVVGQSVRCRTPDGNLGDAQPITVYIVAVDSSVENPRAVRFKYVNPTITGFSPTLGPAAGGTVVRIVGTSLNTGRDIAVVVGGVKCDIDTESINETSVECRTGNSSVGAAGKISLSIDGAVRNSADMFTYKANPTVENVHPRRSFKSGGRRLNVTGTGLSVVGKATILVRRKNFTNEEDCMIMSNEYMMCVSPAIGLSEHLASTCTSEVILGFWLDGVQLTSWSTSLGGRTFTYCPDPVFEKFPGEEFVVEGNTRDSQLTIKGHIDISAINRSEITVTVGSEPCPIEVLESSIITCHLPDEEPDGLDANGQPDPTAIPSAVVHWYGNQKFTPGRVVYPAYSTPIIVGVFVTALVAATILVVVMIRRYIKQKRLLRSLNNRLLNRIRELQEEILEAASKLVPGPSENAYRGSRHKSTPKRKTVALNNKINIMPNDLQIGFNLLDMTRVLGQGAFGRVYHAILRDFPVGTQQDVAVKTIQDTSDSRNIIKFMEEGLLMKNFDHPNVLPLLGLTFNPEGHPVIVLPLMSNGDLLSFVKHQGKALTVLQLLGSVLHVARGMEYLASQHFVHRDLAARNCMVDDQLVVKIADFGLSRDLDESDYYRSSDKQAKLPVKWMAPESLGRRVYNTQTDVWSYGVLVWEIFSGGRKPYPNVANADVYDFLSQGHRMNPPKFCPKKISEIMRRCWREKPKTRCSFQQIVRELEDLVAWLGSGGPTAASEPRRPHQEPVESADIVGESSVPCLAPCPPPPAHVSHADPGSPQELAPRRETNSETQRGPSYSNLSQVHANVYLETKF